MDKRLFIILFALVILLVGGYFAWQKQQSVTTPTPVVTEPVVKEPVPAPTEEPIDTSDWKTYRNEEYGFEFKYPKEWAIKKTTTPAVFYLRSEKFQPVFLGNLASGEPFYSDGEIKVEIFTNVHNLSIQERYSQFDDIYRAYANDPKLLSTLTNVNHNDLLTFETHRGFGRNLDSDEYQTVRILKIKDKILHFDYISQNQPDSRVEQILAGVVHSVSEL